MILGRVIGKVVATMKNDTLVGQRLLIVQPIDRHGRDKGKAIVALDSVVPERVKPSTGAEAKKPAFRFFPSRFPRKQRSSELWTKSTSLRNPGIPEC